VNLQLLKQPSIHRRLPLTKRDARLLVNALNRLWATRAATAINIEVDFVDKETIGALHRDFLQDPSETDVITFDLGMTPEARRMAAIVICVPVAQKYAEQYGVSLREELLRLIIHGALHLLGYDDHTAAGKRRMRIVENKTLNKLAACE